MSNTKCFSECMTISPVDSQSAVPPVSNATAGGPGGFSPLWLLSGLPVVGIGGIILSGGSSGTVGSSLPITPPPAVPIGDIALLPATVLTLIMLILVKARMKSL